MTPIEMREDLTTRTAYVSDASIYRRVPAAVVEPHSVEEIREALSIASERSWPVACRGGGTSVAGNAIGEGLIIDMSRYFNEILAIDPQTHTARVRPGVVCDSLRDAAEEFGLTYGPDPSTHSRCTIGGMFANNACGSHSVAWGTAADNIVSLKLMLGDGREIEIGSDYCSDSAIEAQLKALRDEHLAILRTELGQFSRQVSGYGLHHLLPENGFNVARAMAGTEGTCGVITELTVRLVERPRATALAVLGFSDVFLAAAAAPVLRRPEVYTVEGMGADLLTALRSRSGQESAGSELPEGGGWLYVEVGGQTSDDAGMAARRLVDELVNDGRIVDSVIVTEPHQARELWRIREAGAGIVTRLPDGGEAWPGWEDSAVPPEHLAAYLRDLYKVMEAHGLRGIPFGHFGEGCVHLRIDFSLGTEEGVLNYRRFIDEAARLVARYGGSVSGEHGDGRARSELLPLIYSGEALSAFAKFKSVFDKANLFNPGVLVEPEPIDQGIRPGPGNRTFELTPVHAFSRDGGSFAGATNRCVGVGLCRSDTGSMCPSYKVTRDEVHSTRGRARVLGEMLRGESITDGWRSKETLAALDLCLSCKACSSECPVNVDMATYKAEFLYHHYKGRLRPMAHYAMGWLPLMSRILEATPGAARLVNWTLGFHPVEELVKRLAGIEPKRRMIYFAPQTLRKWFRKRSSGAQPRVDPGQRTVMLWPDTFNNFNSPGVGQAAVEVLESMGYRVILPDGQVCCGLTWHSTGQLDMAKRIISRTLDSLGPALDGNLPIIGLEPSCNVMLADEITELLPEDPRAAKLALQIRTLADFVASHQGPWPFGDINTKAISQVHCHQEAKGTYDTDKAVLQKLGVDTDIIGSGCCGLAGNFGFEPGHWDVSQSLAELELFPKIRTKDDATLVLADGFSCRTQVEQGTEADALHLAELLRLSLDQSRSDRCPNDN